MISPSDLISNPWVSFITGGVTLTGVKYIADVFISSMPSPTATSSAKYQYWFTVLNKFAANWSRAKNNTVESSPNFTDAVKKANGNGGNGH